MAKNEVISIRLRLATKSTTPVPTRRPERNRSSAHRAKHTSRASEYEEIKMYPSSSVMVTTPPTAKSPAIHLPADRRQPSRKARRAARNIPARAITSHAHGWLLPKGTSRAQMYTGSGLMLEEALTVSMKNPCASSRPQSAHDHAS